MIAAFTNQVSGEPGAAQSPRFGSQRGRTAFGGLLVVSFEPELALGEACAPASRSGRGSLSSKSRKRVAVSAEHEPTLHPSGGRGHPVALRRRR